MLIGLLVPACRDVPEPAPTPARFALGAHDVALDVPPGWEHLREDGAHRFKRDVADISLIAFGPVTPEALRRRLEAARVAFRRHDPDGARAPLERIAVRSIVADPAEWERWNEPWRRVRNGALRDDASRTDVEVAYATLLARVEKLPRPSLRSIVDWVYPELTHGVHREVSEREALEVDGRAALRLETWDRLTHDHRKSFVFVLDDEHLLVLWMGLGRFETVRPAFDALVDSLVLHGRRPVERPGRERPGDPADIARR